MENKITLGNGFLIPSVVYNGQTMTKAELIMYLGELLDTKGVLEQIDQEQKLLKKEQDKLSHQCKRKQMVMPIMPKPTGLAALSARKKREYEYWLNNADQREAEKKRFDEEEDKRIQLVEQKKDEVTNNIFKNIGKIHELVEHYQEMILRQIIPPDYRKGEIMTLLMDYLLNGRANTLTDALNLYHAEVHYGNMERLAAEKIQEDKKAYHYMRALAEEQIRIQENNAEKLQKIGEDIEAAKDAVESAKTLLWSDYISN